MVLSLDEIIFRSRALAQAHPFSRSAQAYLKTTVARESEEQAAPEIGIWAGYAITIGYCRRRVEEIDAEGKTAVPPDDLRPLLASAPDLDDLTTDICERIQSERAGDLLLYSESLVIDALDRIIAGEIERRLSHGSDKIDQETFSQLESYLAWWTVKGYALRVAEQLVDEQEGKEKEGSAR